MAKMTLNSTNKPPTPLSRLIRYTFGTVSFALFLSLLYIVASLKKHTPFSPLGVSYLNYAAFYFLQDEWTGEDFYQELQWIWETENDPTHGRVNYIGLAEAQSKNLTYVENGAFFMRADDTTFVPPSARGRDSIRISSQNAYSESIIVLDVQHMPAGCSTWPAFWSLSKAGPWPNGGEIDIIEGVNLNVHNQATLHTTANCTMPPQFFRELETGKPVTADCDVAADFNEGCGVLFTDRGSSSCTSYGAPFNLAGGGYYVTYRGPDSVKVWFFPRDGDVPDVIRYGGQRGTPMFPDFTWPLPAAVFPFYPEYCDYETHFNAHILVFDLTFCGDWAGNVYSTSGCGTGTCTDFVNNNPSAFAEAYWAINSLRVYTPQPQW